MDVITFITCAFSFMMSRKKVLPIAVVQRIFPKPADLKPDPCTLR